MTSAGRFTILQVKVSFRRERKGRIATAGGTGKPAGNERTGEQKRNKRNRTRTEGRRLCRSWRPAAAAPRGEDHRQRNQSGSGGRSCGDPGADARAVRSCGKCTRRADSLAPSADQTAGSRSDTHGTEKHNREQWQQDGHERQAGEQLRKIRQEPNATSSGNRSEQPGGAGEDHRRTRSEEPKTPKRREKAESRIKHRRPNRRPRTVTAAAMPTATRLFDSF